MKEKKINLEEVRKIATLCRLRLEEKELEKYSGQLGEIVSYFELLSEVNTDQVKIEAGSTKATNVLREDKEIDFDSRDGLLACPKVKTKNNLFVAKSVF